MDNEIKAATAQGKKKTFTRVSAMVGSEPENNVES